MGPVSAAFSGSVKLSDIQPPESYVIVGEGKGGAAGFAKGTARVTLAESDDGGTVLSYTVDVGVGGRLAQLGSRLIGGAMDQYSTAFFNSFADMIGAEAAPDAAPTTAALTAGPEEPRTRVPDRKWQSLLIVGLGLLAALVALVSLS